MNANVGKNNTNREEVVGKLEQISLKKISISLPGVTRWEDSKPDSPCLVNGNMRTSILDTKVMRGADVYSEHYLVKTRICLKLARFEGRNNVRERFDVSKLQSEEAKNCLEKDSQERAKQSWVEKLGSSQSDCTRSAITLLVRQRGGIMRLPAR